MKNKTSHLVRYVIAGGLAYAIELGFLISLHKLLHFSATLATAVAFWAGLLSAFWLQKLFAFKDYSKTRKAIANQMVGYGLLVGLNYAFTLFIVSIFPDSLLLVSRTLALIITTVWNFFLYKIIFSPNPQVVLNDYLNSCKNIPGSVLEKLKKNRRKITFFTIASSIVVLFFYQYLSTPNKIIPGDFDYYLQMTEAARVTLIKYHQLPLWNPWMSGGLPLFANPQFGLFSPQIIFSLLFGTIVGMKIAYILYALTGFWGMFALCRHVFESDKIRALSISYIWIFCGFYAGHNISHFTFTSFFLIPWLVYFIARRREKWSWLGFGLTETIIILSSMHYAFLMTLFVAGMLYVLLLALQHIAKYKFKNIKKLIVSSDVWFVIKAGAFISIFAGYRMITTYYFVKHNEKSALLLQEPPNNPSVVFKAIFYPIGTFVKSFPKTTWGWGEYSMYFGIGTGIAVSLIVLSLIYVLLTKRKDKRPVLTNGILVCALLVVGAIAAAFALGDFSPHSPFHLLRKIPGFTQTRVPARWVLFSMFSLLTLVASWKKQRVVINLLLVTSVLELFLSYGPPKISGSQEVQLPKGTFSSTFTQYDNGKDHLLDGNGSLMHSYLYTTFQNIGQVYADDSLVDTLHGTIGTSRCGLNVNTKCSLILTTNASIDYWSPNKIIIKRTAPGRIELNMNVEAGWRVNNEYPYWQLKKLDPANLFVLPDNQDVYTLEYAPKLSPSWLLWHLRKI